MIALYTISGALILLVIIQTIGNVLVQRNLARSINILSDKIMARNYREYVGMQKGLVEEDDSPKKEAEPLGWYDN